MGKGQQGPGVSSNLTTSAMFFKSSNFATLPDKLTFEESWVFFPSFHSPSVVNVTKTNRREEGFKHQNRLRQHST